MREFPTKVSRHRYIPSLTTGSVIGLVAGLGLGTLAYRLQSGPLLGVLPIVEPIGGLWVNALRMTVIPLVVSQMFVIIAAKREGLGVGGLGLRACAILLVLLLTAAGFTAVVGPAIVSRISFSPATLAQFRAVAAGAADLARQARTESPGAADWLLGLVPTNVFRAAADGKMLPLILFTVLFALAVRKIPAEPRASLEAVFRGISEATFVLIGWILLLTPVGAFALTYQLAAGSGLGAARALLYYIVLVSALLLAFTSVFYVIAVLVARVPLARFARGLLPAQVVGVSTRSSLASLPALMKGAEDELGMSSSISGFALPLAVTTFRVNMMVSSLFTILFLGKLYGIPIGPLGMATFVAILLPITVAVPGIPTHLGLTGLPAYVALGIPVEGVVILYAVDAIPDIFKTITNVTGDMTAATLLARFAGEPVGQGAPAGEGGAAGPQRAAAQETSRVAIS